MTGNGQKVWLAPTMADISNAAASQDRREFLGLAALPRPLLGTCLNMSTQVICE